jgi:hypothetical protein
MKKIMILMGMAAFIACNNNVKEEDKSTPPAAAPVQQTPPPAEGQKDGTTIKVNNDGVSVESKDGSNKSNVKVSQDSTNIEISRPK